MMMSYVDEGVLEALLEDEGGVHGGEVEFADEGLEKCRGVVVVAEEVGEEGVGEDEGGVCGDKGGEEGAEERSGGGADGVEDLVDLVEEYAGVGVKQEVHEDGDTGADYLVLLQSEVLF